MGILELDGHLNYHSIDLNLLLLLYRPRIVMAYMKNVLIRLLELRLLNLIQEFLDKGPYYNLLSKQIPLHNLILLLLGVYKLFINNFFLPHILNYMHPNLKLVSKHHQHFLSPIQRKL